MILLLNVPVNGLFSLGRPSIMYDVLVFPSLVLSLFVNDVFILFGSTHNLYGFLRDSFSWWGDFFFLGDSTHLLSYFFIPWASIWMFS